MSGVTNPTPPLQCLNNLSSVPYLKIIYFQGTASAGTLVVHPTNDGTATGTALFSNILHATATPWVAVGGALTATPVIAGQSIASDYRTVTFSLVSVNGLASTTSATCTVVVYGAP